MTGTTHIAIACAATTCLFPATSPLGQAKVLAAASLGALLPDIDTPHSTLGSKLPGQTRIGRLIIGGLLFYMGVQLKSNRLQVIGPAIAGTALLRHRGITHSLLACWAVFAAAQALTPTTWQPFLLGYVLHIATDALTPMKIPLLWPLPYRIGWPVMKNAHTCGRIVRYAAIGIVAVYVGKLLIS